MMSSGGSHQATCRASQEPELTSRLSAWGSLSGRLISNHATERSAKRPPKDRLCHPKGGGSTKEQLEDVSELT